MMIVERARGMGSLRRAFGAVGFLMAVALAPAAPAIEKDSLPSPIEEMRALERVAIDTIARAKAAFVFIGGGSGFSISADGFILTNEHVVQGASEVTVVFTGGEPYRADVVGHDPQGDVALLKVRGGKDLPWLPLGDSDALKTGQSVLAIGDPFLIGSASIFLTRVPPDHEPSASLGVISALHRYSDTYNDAIQVDLAVNRGNSGGPLITLGGEVVGINGKIETRFALGINTGVGYAVPSSQILRFLEPLKKAKGGHVRHGTIRGIEVAERVGDRDGLPVQAVAPGSAAERAGFRKGDLLISIGGLPVKTATRFKGILATYPEGDVVPVKVDRGGEAVEFRAALVASGRAFLGVMTEAAGEKGDGLRVVRVVSGAPAQRSGLQPGDVIRKLDGKDLATSTDLAGHLRGKAAGDIVTLEVSREGKTLELRVRLGARPD